MIVKILRNNLIESVIFCGQFKGETAFIPRISLKNSDSQVSPVSQRAQMNARFSLNLAIVVRCQFVCGSETESAARDKSFVTNCTVRDNTSVRN